MVVTSDKRVIPLSLEVANNFVSQFHRHNKKVQGAKFAIGLMCGKELIGVAIAGRPVARMLDNGLILEILRVCVKNGYKTANSELYGRIRRIAQLMGYQKVITYTLESESGSSLKAVGASPVSLVKPQAWSRENRRRDFQQIYNSPKIR